jgi:hypothetical protein
VPRRGHQARLPPHLALHQDRHGADRIPCRSSEATRTCIVVAHGATRSAPALLQPYIHGPAPATSSLYASGSNDVSTGAA